MFLTIANELHVGKAKQGLGRTPESARPPALGPTSAAVAPHQPGMLLN